MNQKIDELDFEKAIIFELIQAIEHVLLWHRTIENRNFYQTVDLDIFWLEILSQKAKKGIELLDGRQSIYLSDLTPSAQRRLLKYAIKKISGQDLFWDVFPVTVLKQVNNVM